MWAPAWRKTESPEWRTPVKITVPVGYIGHRPVIVGPDDGQSQDHPEPVSQVCISPGALRKNGIGNHPPTLFRIIDGPAAQYDRHGYLIITDQCVMNHHCLPVSIFYFLQQVRHEINSRGYQWVQYPPVMSGQCVADKPVFRKPDKSITGVRAKRFPI